MSLRSSVVVVGSTISAWRAVAVHHGSCLMMMERVAARPIDEANVGIAGALSVVIIGAAGIEQAVADAGRRNGAAERIGEDFHGGRAEGERRLGNAAGRAIAEAKAAARQ